MTLMQICHDGLYDLQVVEGYYKEQGYETKSIRYNDESFVQLLDPTGNVSLIGQNQNIRNLAKIIHDAGFISIEVLIYDLFDLPDQPPIKINNELPRLDRLEIEIFKRCNLNCKGCSHYSNLVTGPGEVDINRFESDLKQLSKFYWGIETLRLMGGEPLLAKNFTEYVEIARQIFPDADISLVTNGLLIPKLKAENFEKIRNNRCRFIISAYPPTLEIIKDIQDILEKEGIPYNIGPAIKRFYKSLLENPRKSAKESFDHCIFSGCHALYEGKLSMCGLELYSPRLNAHLNCSLPEDGSIDLYSTTLNGWEIDKQIRTAQNQCRYCHTAYIPFKWESVSKSGVKKEDYFIGDSAYEQKIMPALQKAFLPTIKRVYSRYVLKHNKINGTKKKK